MLLWTFTIKYIDISDFRKIFVFPWIFYSHNIWWKISSNTIEIVLKSWIMIIWVKRQNFELLYVWNKYSENKNKNKVLFYNTISITWKEIVNISWLYITYNHLFCANYITDIIRTLLKNITHLFIQKLKEWEALSNKNLFLFI